MNPPSGADSQPRGGAKLGINKALAETMFSLDLSLDFAPTVLMNAAA
jgi:hypothetical protein